MAESYQYLDVVCFLKGSGLSDLVILRLDPFADLVYLLAPAATCNLKK